MKNLKNFLLWGKVSLKAIVFGAAICGIIFLLWKDLPVSLFFGTFMVYMFIGGAVVNLAAETNNLDGFYNANIIIGILMFVESILGFIFWPEIKLLTWPTMVSGFVLFVVALISFGMNDINYDPYY